jgi:probable F420-dependent oxidoreductase
MKLAVEFPNVIYREGQAGVAALARAIEAAGYDQLDMFDHVVMAHPVEGEARGPYSSNMPILEALMTLAFAAAVTERIGLGTEVLVLPQRAPVLVAKQVETLDTLSGGRVRLGVGVGWQEREYEALGHDFHRRGVMMDEAIGVLRACWSEQSISFDGPHYRARAIAMEPKPPRAGGIPIWIGGGSPAALKRAGTLGDGWLAGGGATKAQIAIVRQHAEAAGRDPSTLGFQTWVTAPPREGDADARGFYADLDRVAAVAGRAAEQGFDWLAVNGTGVFLAGARSGEQLAEALAAIHDRIRREVG